ncbi:MAG TPA: hypothetical protein VGU74_11745 [Gemmatimonadales bacterium]|nr:hypothetical protein [Gemmatimonadales bacterium]
MRYLFLLLLAVAGGSLPAQSARPTGEQIAAAVNAHKNEFDYLLGDWQFTAVNKQDGNLNGYWSAVKLEAGQILDEYRIVGDSGETYYVTTTIRNYNGAANRWELIGTEPGRGLLDFGTATKVGDEMHIVQTFGVAAGTPSKWRIRYFNIQPDRFSWTADRSTDDGRTWVSAYQTLEARRIGPARTMGALAPARKRKP